jgi:hypothetical protein
MARVNEKTTSYLTVKFYDKDKVLAAPSTITYTVYDVDTNTKIIDTTSVTPGSTVEITLPGGTANVIVTTGKRIEKRRVTIQASYGGSDTLKENYFYEVVNLEDVS